MNKKKYEVNTKKRVKKSKPIGRSDWGKNLNDRINKFKNFVESPEKFSKKRAKSKTPKDKTQKNYNLELKKFLSVPETIKQSSEKKVEKVNLETNKKKKVFKKNILQRLYAGVFIISLLLSLVYALTKDFFLIPDLFYVNLYIVTLIIALISYASYRILKGKIPKISPIKKPKIPLKKFSLPQIDKKSILRLIYSILAVIGVLSTIPLIVYAVWSLLLVSLILTFISLLALSKLRKKNVIIDKVSVSNIMGTKKWYETDVDKLVQYVNINNYVKLSSVASGFKVSKEKAEMWGKMLEEHNLIKLHYPALGEVEFLNVNFKESHAYSRTIFKYFLVMLSIVGLLILVWIGRTYIL